MLKGFKRLIISALETIGFRTGNDPIPHWNRSDSALESIRFRTGFDRFPHWNSGKRSFFLDNKLRNRTDPQMPVVIPIQCALYIVRDRKIW
jgi:hypothetical protein